MQRMSVPQVCLIVIMPIVYVMAFVVLGHQKGPYWLRPNQDPDYAYLINSLAIANFEVPGHIHHPGTPVQTLGAIALWFSHAAQVSIGNTPLSLNDAVLTRPEFYLHTIGYMFLGLSALGLLILGWVTFAVSNRLLLAMLSQVTPLVFVQNIMANEPSRVAPEAMLFVMSQLLATLLVIYLYCHQVEQTRRFAINFGVVFGLGMAAKVTFLPTIIFGLAIAGYRCRLLALGVACITFLVATLPIASRYGEFVQWIFNLATHTEPYGSGEQGLPPLSSLSNELAQLIHDDGLFFYLLVVFSVICVISMSLRWISRGEKSRQPQAEATESIPAALTPFNSKFDSKRDQLILLLTTFMWSQVFITIMEAGRSRYLVSAVGLCGLLLLLTVTWIESLPAYRNCVPHSAPIACLLIYGIGLGVSIQQYHVSSEHISRRFGGLFNQVREVEQLLYDTPQYQECVVVLDRRASSPRAALYFGNLWSGELFSDELAALYPNSVFLRNIRRTNNPLQVWGYRDRISKVELLSAGEDCILLQSNPIENSQSEEQISDIVTLEKLLPGTAETVYRVNF